ncbi:Protein of unknown function [Pseudoxanthomonas sp. GM95]|uniref:DUF2878 domain-containing protein n=1 Tax=Pseudoxanthomonas sp. GM95 TaxID=1881043 RepID=UPI0008BC27D8|nr:DUF2878 domain-containing protein [Pseudoxanthomonas sp. GM95]SEL07064.1 Protein of unknown function [Pseudoxanthomonas sp. GM95]
MWPNLRNYLALQLLWLAAVAGAGRGWWWAGPVALLLFVALHFGLHWQARGDLLLMLAALLLGSVVDSLATMSGVVHYAAAWPFPSLAPLWILALWMGLGLTLNHSFGWLMRRPALAVPVMALGGPLSYWGAQASFGAVHFSTPPFVGLLLIGVSWAVATAVLAALVLHLRRPAPLSMRGVE